MNVIMEFMRDEYSNNNNNRYCSCMQTMSFNMKHCCVIIAYKLKILVTLETF